MNTSLKCSVCKKDVTKMQAAFASLDAYSDGTEKRKLFLRAIKGNESSFTFCPDCAKKYRKARDAQKKTKGTIYTIGSVGTDSIDEPSYCPQVISLLIEAKSELIAAEDRNDGFYPILEVYDGKMCRYYFYKSTFDNAIVETTIGFQDKNKMILDTGMPEYLSVADLHSVNIIYADMYYQPEMTECVYGFKILKKTEGGDLINNMTGPEDHFKIGEMVVHYSRKESQYYLHEYYHSFWGRLEEIMGFYNLMEKAVTGKESNEKIFFVKGCGHVITDGSYYLANALTVLHEVTPSEFLEYFEIEKSAKANLIEFVGEDAWNRYFASIKNNAM